MVKVGPNELIFGAIDAEFRGEAESELRLLANMGNHWYFPMFERFRSTTMRPAMWPNELLLS